MLPWDCYEHNLALESIFKRARYTTKTGARQVCNQNSSRSVHRRRHLVSFRETWSRQAAPPRPGFQQVRAQEEDCLLKTLNISQIWSREICEPKLYCTKIYTVTSLQQRHISVCTCNTNRLQLKPNEAPPGCVTTPESPNKTKTCQKCC